MNAPTLTVDGRQVPVRPGASILASAVEAGIRIPHLCWDARLPAVGSCRLCLVRVGGRLVPACATQASAGQVVESESPDLRSLRRDLLRMLFVEGNHFCPFCEASGACELQAQAYRHELLDFAYEHQYPQRELDASHPDVLLERDRCIMCGLCVRASQQLDHKGVFELGGRGSGTRLMVESATGRLGDSALAADDQAVSICPTGALSLKHTAFVTPIGQRRHDRHEGVE